MRRSELTGCSSQRRSTASASRPKAMPAARRARAYQRTIRAMGTVTVSDEVVTYDKAVTLRVRDFHDRMAISPGRILLRQVHLPARGCNHGTVAVDRNADDGAVELRTVGVGGRDDGDVERVEDHAGPDRVDADEVDEGLHEHWIIAPAGVLPHLPQDLVRLDRARLIAAAR